MSNEDSNIFTNIPSEWQGKLSRHHADEFSVPKDFFHAQATSIRLKSLDAMEDEFQVSDDYFELFADRIQSSIGDHKEVSDAFFESQQQEIVAVVRIDQWTQKEKTEFEVPESYFDRSESTIIRRVRSIDITKVISFRQFVRFAAAAVFLIAGLFIFLPNDSDQVNGSFAEMIEENPVDIEDLEYFASEDDYYDLYLHETEELSDTIIVDSLSVDAIFKIETPLDSAGKVIRLDPRNGLPLDKNKNGKSNEPSWDDLSDEDLMKYLMEESDEDLLNELN